MERSYFDIGREHYLKKEYTEAVKCFKAGAGMNSSGACMMWLGQCYEYGLGVERNLVEAKDLYRASLRCCFMSDKSREWLNERVDSLKDIPIIDERTMFIEGIGNLKIRRNRSTYEPVVRYNLNEVVVTLDDRDCFFKGIQYAMDNVPKLNEQWTCDGKRRFYDGYTLMTDHFNLVVKRGTSEKYVSVMDGRDCTLYFPADACLDYIYIQESILKKVQVLLFRRAQVILPQKLREVSQKINVPYKKCNVILRARRYVAINYDRGNKIEFCAQCVQLPDESLEALCIHELTHNYVLSHNRAFYQKMEELGGSRVVDLDIHLWEEGKWSYVRF